MRARINYLRKIVIYLALAGLLILTSCMAESDNTPLEPAVPPPPPDITAPRILDVSVIITENNTITVRWYTEEEATSEAQLFDIAGEKQVQAAADDKYVQRHALTLDGNLLKADITYSITLFSSDRAGNKETRYNAKMLSVNTLAAQNAAYRIFKLPRLDGTQVSLTDFKGRQVLLHFWIYGCHVCEEELPLFNALYSSMLPSEMPLLVICTNAEIGQVREYLTTHNLTLPVLIDQTGTVAIAYGVLTFPSTYIVETDGKVIKTKDGKFDYMYDIQEFMGLRSHLLNL